MAEIRIDKFLADRTSYSRSEIKAFLKKGAVQVNGITITDSGQKVIPDKQEIIFNGKKIHGGSEFYVIVNKPENYICATEDRQHKTVLELLPEELRHKDMFPAGRLDIDTTGFVLLTTDGNLAHQILSPKHHVPKYYLVTLSEPLTEIAIQKLSDGIELSDGTLCLPAEAKTISERICVICLHEGKYHQVKRMFASLGNHVEHLHRVAVGSLLLPPNLPVGGHLEIFHKDIQNLLKSKTFQVMYEQIVTDFSSYSINDGQEV